jgi:hypothetical protein
VRSCTERCRIPQQCAPGCCVLHDDGLGVCAPESACVPGCGMENAVCLLDQDCCEGLLCKDGPPNGPALCGPVD